MSETFKMIGEVYYCPNCRGITVIYRLEREEYERAVGNCPICSEDDCNPELADKGEVITGSILLEELEKLRQKLKKEYENEQKKEK